VEANYAGYKLNAHAEESGRLICILYRKLKGGAKHNQFNHRSSLDLTTAGENFAGREAEDDNN
jgi:hypothetical protein